MERRVLIAVLLSFLVLYGYQLMFPAPKEADQKPVQASKTATAPNASTPAPANPTPSVQAATPPAESTEPPASEVVVENADVRGVFTTRGAALKSWQLKKYRDEQKRPYEVVAGHAPSDAPLPFTLAVDDAAVAAKLATAARQSVAVLSAVLSKLLRPHTTGKLQAKQRCRFQSV